MGHHGADTGLEAPPSGRVRGDSRRRRAEAYRDIRIALVRPGVSVCIIHGVNATPRPGAIVANISPSS